MRWCVVVVLLVAVRAAAAPDPIALRKDQIDAAQKAAAARLPPVDHAKADQCTKDHAKAMQGASAAEMDAAAACYRAAGALGAAIRIWQQTARDFGNTKEGEDAARQLGAAFEAAGFYVDAAQWHRDYARKYGGEPDARGKLIRAVCIERQLGLPDDAAKDTDYLAKTWRKIKVDRTHLCDLVRPIDATRAP